MKSKVIKMYDYHDYDLPKVIYIEGVKEQVEKEKHHLLRPYKTKQPVEVVAESDLVVMNLTSEYPKFNKKNIPVNVGKGLFDKKLEAKIVGQKVGESVDITVEVTTDEGSKEVPVMVEIVSGHRMVYPELTDEMVAAGMADSENPEIKTVEAYNTYIYDKTFDAIGGEKIGDLVWDLMCYTVEHSEFELDEEELNQAFEDYMADAYAEAEEEGWDLENMSEDEFRMISDGFNNLQEYKDNAKVEIAAMIKRCAIEGVLRGEDYSEKSLDEMADNLWEIIADYVEHHVDVQEANA